MSKDISFLFGWAKENGITVPQKNGQADIEKLFQMYNNSMESQFEQKKKEVQDLQKNSIEDLQRLSQLQYETLKKGRGYDGYSMSNNARLAYENNQKPLSKWDKESILDAIKSVSPEVYEKVKKLNLDILKKQFLKYAGYHHTGKYFNSTNFYEISEDAIERFDDNTLERIKSTRKPKQKTEETKKPKYITAKVRYTVWEGNGRYKKKKYYTEIVRYSPNDKMIKTANGDKRLSSLEIIHKEESDKKLTDAQFEKKHTKAIQEINKKREEERKAIELKSQNEYNAIIDSITNEEGKKWFLEAYPKHTTLRTRSSNGNIYKPGEKPSSWEYDANKIPIGRQRLSYTNGTYQLQTYTGTRWE